MKKSELRQIIREELLKEASEISLNDIPPDRLATLKKMKLTPMYA